MKLVFVTRKVDRGDSLTGFIFGWINSLAKDSDRLYVICQEKGDIAGLPSNVEISSFGKEKGYGKIRQSYNLFMRSYKFGRQTDGFFIHMHPIYAIICALPAMLLGKKMVLWYTHKSVDLKLRIAHALVDRVLTASKESFRLPSKKVRVIGHGIDLKKFKVQNVKSKITNQNVKFRIVSIGRISPVKDYETLIKAAEILYHDKAIHDFEVDIYGKIGLSKHQVYLDSLVDFVHNADLESVVKFQGELNHEYADEVYQEADLFINLSQTGSIDKSVLEAAACGTLVLTSNEAFRGVFQVINRNLIFSENNPEDLAEKILILKNMTKAEKANLSSILRSWVEKNHNLEVLSRRIVEEFSA